MGPIPPLIVRQAPGPGGARSNADVRDVAFQGRPTATGAMKYVVQVCVAYRRGASWSAEVPAARRARSTQLVTEVLATSAGLRTHPRRNTASCKHQTSSRGGRLNSGCRQPNWGMAMTSLSRLDLSRALSHH